MMSKVNAASKLDDASMMDLACKRGQRIRKGSKKSRDAFERNNQPCVTNFALKATELTEENGALRSRDKTMHPESSGRGNRGKDRRRILWQV